MNAMNIGTHIILSNVPYGVSGELSLGAHGVITNIAWDDDIQNFWYSARFDGFTDSHHFIGAGNFQLA